MEERYWCIRGYDSTDKFFDEMILAGRLTQKQLKLLLRCLAGKAGLSYNEIIMSHTKKNTLGHNDFLRVTRDGPYQNYMCGENPYFTADLVDQSGKRVPYPKS